MNFLRDPIWQFIGVLFAIIVVVAPFVYREIKRRLKKPGIDFVVTDHSCSLNLTVGNNLPRNDVFIDDGFHLDISGHFDVSINDPELADAYVHIHSIQTNWDMDLVEMEKVEVRVEVPKTDYIFENPILLRNRNFLPKCRFSTVIPIRIPPIEQNKYHPFKFIGSLTKFEVIIGIDIKEGQEVLLSPFNPNISNFHQNVEHQLIQLAVQQARQVDAVPNAIFALKDLWQEIL